VQEVILGIDFLKSQGASWFFKRAEVVLNGHIHQLYPRGEAGWSRRVVAAKTVTVPCRSECVIPAYVLYNDAPKPWGGCTGGWVTERAEPVDGLHVSRVMMPDRSVDLPVRVLNVIEREVTVCDGTVLADLEHVTDISASEDPCENDVTSKRLKLVDDLVDRADESVPDEMRCRLRRLLESYSTILSTGETDIGRTGVVQHEIDTDNARPIRQALRRHPPAHATAIQWHMSEMLKQGIIEPAQSQWASNIVLVRKKDGSLRCCVDYRRLNQVTRKDTYPLPRIDVCLDGMSGAQWFSTFDFRSSYHQVEVRPENADNTAFICREGLFRFLTMPFGLCGAPATFQRLMDMMMSGLNFEICLVYLDDIIVFSTTLEQHLERLCQVLDRIRTSGLKIRPSKTHLLRRSVNFLGHVVSYQGIEPQTEKLAAVRDWPQPENVRDVKASLGLCTYYRRFVEGFADRAAPLYELLTKNKTFKWTNRCQQSFDDLKVALTSAPVLGMPNETDPFVLDTDASDEAIGAVLSQVQEAKETVIAYASRRLSQAERNYCVTRRELLAVVAFVKYFRHYILGRRFVIRTDHAALQWLSRVLEQIGQQARRLELLEEYDFDVIHRAGSRHGNADAMSRRSCDKSRCCRGRDTPVQLGNVQTTPGDVASVDHLRCFAVNIDKDSGQQEGTWTAQSIAEAEKQDSNIAPIREMLVNGLEKPSWDVIAGLSAMSKTLWRQWERLKLFRGILMRRFINSDGNLECLQTVMPRGQRTAFITMLHEGSTGGHLGRRRTGRQVQLRAYWPGWTGDVAEVLRKCIPCARYHRGKAPRQTPLKPFQAGEPWEVISIDITDPHPKSRRGHVYILTLVDHFTKWAEALPIRNHTAETVDRVLFDHIFSRFGMPVRCLSDQRAEFESVLFTQLCQLIGINKLRTTPHKPSTNAVVERFHRTLNSMFAKVVSDNQRDWCEHLPSVMAAYRASAHESTQFSPNRLMFGHKNRLPVDIVLGELAEPSPTVALNDFVASARDRQLQEFALVREHLGQAARRRKEQYDDKVNARAFQPGQLVWYYYPRRRQGLSPKWQKFYTGPYRVIRLIDTHNVVIQKSKRTKCIVVHKDKLKPCFKDAPNKSEAHAVEDTQPPTSSIAVGMFAEEADPIGGDSGSLPNITEVERSSRRVDPWEQQETCINDCENTRPRRTVRQPKHLSDYVVCPVYRVSSVFSDMSAKEVEMGRARGIVCEACGRRFQDRHGVKYHLQHFPGN
jgi:transposase InsO family protein